MEQSGSPLQWEEDEDSGDQTCSIRLRHFLSGRLLMVSLNKGKTRISTILTLANAEPGQLEMDGDGISSKKILKKANRIQNYVFKLTNRATVDETILTKETVANLSNEGTKQFISTDNAALQAEQGEDSAGDENEDGGEEENENKFDDSSMISKMNKSADSKMGY